jgi:hypothetical protein
VESSDIRSSGTDEEENANSIDEEEFLDANAYGVEVCGENGVEVCGEAEDIIDNGDGTYEIEVEVPQQAATCPRMMCPEQ